MYLAGAGGSPRAVSTGGVAEGGHTAVTVGRGSSGVCVATAHFALSAVKRLAASGAGNSAVIFLVDVNSQAIIMRQHTEKKSPIWLKTLNINGHLFPAGVLQSFVKNEK